jgi:hypothetical protein
MRDGQIRHVLPSCDRSVSMLQCMLFLGFLRACAQSVDCIKMMYDIERAVERNTLTALAGGIVLTGGILLVN